MDPALLREREAFRKKAYSQPVVENFKRKERPDGEADVPKPKKSKPSSGPASSTVTSSSRDLFARHTGAGSANFSILSKIIKHMKTRYSQEDTEPLSLNELLDETNQLDIGYKQKQWLESEALINNPKVEVTPDGKYAFKPVFRLKDKRSLIRLLDKYDREGKGGILLEDIQESLPNADRILNQVASSIIRVKRPTDKKEILFYNDKSMQLSVDEEFQKLWRSVPVDGIDEQKIEDYLNKQGIASMQDSGGRKNPLPIQKRKKAAAKRQRQYKKTNEHMGDILKDYSDSV